MRAELEQLAAATVAAMPGLTVTIETGLWPAPFEAIRDSRIVTTVLKQVAVATGAPAIERGEPFWADCGLISDAGIPVVLFGVAGGRAHAATECVDLRSVDIVTSVL